MNASQHVRSFFKHPVVSGGLKIGVTVVCLWYVSHKIDWLLTWQLLVGSNKGWLAGAVVFFTISKIVSAFRLNIYFRNIAVNLPERTNLRLYWLGMFYNLFLPGGIGGDAYKVIALHRKGKFPVRLLSAAVLLDRLSGVAGLGILSSIYYFLLFKGAQYSTLITLLVVPGLGLYYLLVRHLFRTFLQSFTSTLMLGIVVQFLQVICVYCLMYSIGLSTNLNAFVLLFLLSSVVAILPFTIGGLGAREVVFLWGSGQLGLDPHQSIYISVLFYLVTVLVSFVGARWIYRDPLQE